MVFPHQKTDWTEYLEEARATFANIVDAIRKYEPVLLVCADVEEAKRYFDSLENIEFVEFETDDTWARDISAISVEEDGEVVLYDFEFNAWGGKFAYAKDNVLTSAIASRYPHRVRHIDFILEGGGIESNGKGVLLSTSACMLNANRNALDEVTTTQKLKEFFGLDEVLYLRHGYLAGDDTDSHIDTLARFVDERTIMYVRCEEKEDEHYEELAKMEAELEAIAKEHDFDLIALPFCDPLYYKNERLPATYANFLMINDAVLVPLYGVRQDVEALEIFGRFFKDLDVIGIDCSVLVRQHGSLHCITMNFY